MTKRYIARWLGSLGLTLALAGLVPPTLVSAQTALTRGYSDGRSGRCRRAVQPGLLLCLRYRRATGRCARAWPGIGSRRSRGLAAAQHHLGVMYANGEGTPQDFTEAITWLRRAAAQDYSTARYHLGVMYSNGDGVPNDEAEAVAWFRVAADEGDVPAQYMLGMMYVDGADPVRIPRRAPGSAPVFPLAGGNQPTTWRRHKCSASRPPTSSVRNRGSTRTFATTKQRN